MVASTNVPLPILCIVFKTAEIKIESGPTVEERHLPLSEMTDTEWFKVMNSALAKECKVYDVAFQELRNYMRQIYREFSQGTVSFVITDPPFFTCRLETGRA